MTDPDKTIASAPPRRFAKTLVVGASGGLGGAFVRLLAKRGCAVHALSRGATAFGAEVVSGQCDIDSEASIAAAAERLAGAGPFDLVIVATGLLHDQSIRPEKSLRELSADTLAAYFAVNATGPALVARHFFPLMPRAEPSVFAALSARVGSIGDNRLGGWYGYRASKAALNMLVKTLAIERARTHPQAICLALHPGTVDTPLSRPFQKNVPAGRLFSTELSAGRLLDVMFRATPAQSGLCLDWAGKAIQP